MKKKAQFQVSFSWIFAIVVGVFILFLAIYAATRVIDTGNQAISARTSVEINTLLNPLETGFEASRTSVLMMPVETRINNNCNANIGKFGEQGISISQMRLNQWRETDLETSFKNKYIFSENLVQGEDFFVFLKPFEFPFKVSDVIYITSSEKEYCFQEPPERIEDEVLNLGQDNLFVDNCPGGSIKICFSGNCDIVVNEALKSVEKRGQRMYYETDALLYGAIFSDAETYECQAQRLMQRLETLSVIYEGKSSLQSQKGCSQDVNLVPLINFLKSYQESENLVTVKSLAEDIERENRVAECSLW